jgi:hypothetical protein
MIIEIPVDGLIAIAVITTTVAWCVTICYLDDKLSKKK